MKKDLPERNNPLIKNETTYVSAEKVARRYGVSQRYILKLAAEDKIPSLRIARKCIRFDLEAVAAALEAPSP